MWGWLWREKGAVFDRQKGCLTDKGDMASKVTSEQRPKGGKEGTTARACILSSKTGYTQCMQECWDPHAFLHTLKSFHLTYHMQRDISNLLIKIIFFVAKISQTGSHVRDWRDRNVVGVRGLFHKLWPSAEWGLPWKASICSRRAFAVLYCVCFSSLLPHPPTLIFLNIPKEDLGHWLRPCFPSPAIYHTVSWGVLPLVIHSLSVLWWPFH
jgi:hypothetical protein